MCLEICIYLYIKDRREQREAELVALSRKTAAAAEAMRAAEKADAALKAPPSVFELLQCWLLYGPNLSTSTSPFSPTTQTLTQMLACWDNSSYRVNHTALPEESVKLYGEIYGRYFRVLVVKPEIQGFPQISVTKLRQCWTEHGDGDGDGTTDPLFVAMMDVWAEYGVIGAVAPVAAEVQIQEAKVQPKAYRVELAMEAGVEV